MTERPQFQRIAAYAVIARAGRILLCRLAPRVTREELWTLPGGRLDHGEDPRDAVVREVWEETGLSATVGEAARIYSTHVPDAWRDGLLVDAHALRVVYEGWVPLDAPEPHVVEVDGSTVDVAWVPLSEVHGGAVPVVPMVLDALADQVVSRMQRVAAYAVIRRDDALLLVRVSALGGRHAGRWMLPGGGLHHGEAPERALVREVVEECGVICTPGPLLAVQHTRFTDVAPSGREEDFASVNLVYAATVPDGVEPRTLEVGGTTDRVAWVPLAALRAGRVEVVEVVDVALRALPD